MLAFLYTKSPRIPLANEIPFNRSTPKLGFRLQATLPAGCLPSLCNPREPDSPGLCPSQLSVSVRMSQLDKVWDQPWKVFIGYWGSHVLKGQRPLRKTTCLTSGRTKTSVSCYPTVFLLRPMSEQLPGSDHSKPPLDTWSFTETLLSLSG